MTQKVLLKMVFVVLILCLGVLDYIYMTNVYAISDPPPRRPCGPYPPGEGTHSVNWWFSVEGYYETWPLNYAHWYKGRIRFHVAEAGSWGGGFGFLSGDGTWLRDYQLMGYYTDFWTLWFDESGPNAVMFIRVYGSSIGGANVYIDKYEYNYPGGNTCVSYDHPPSVQKPSEFQETKPQNFSLFQNHPNPFNPETEISYDLPKDSWVKLSIYNIMGQKVATLVDQFEPAGHKTVRWGGKNENGAEVASGTYFYRLAAEDFTATKRMVLLR